MSATIVVLVLFLLVALAAVAGVLAWQRRDRRDVPQPDYFVILERPPQPRGSPSPGRRTSRPKATLTQPVNPDLVHLGRREVMTGPCWFTGEPRATCTCTECRKRRGEGA